MTRNFDVIVVGGGLAGSQAARVCAQAGFNVAVIERKLFPSQPVRCGEGVGFKGMKTSVGIKQKWILSKIRTVAFVAPNGTRVELKNIGESFCVDRTIMDKDLLIEAQKAGAKYFNGRYVCDVEIETREKNEKNAKKTRYIYKCKTDKDEIFRAPVLVAADGVESSIRRKTWWESPFSPQDMETCAFAQVEHPSIDGEAIEFYTGQKIAKGGYLWVFGRGKNKANVGLGILGEYSTPALAKKMFFDFVGQKFEGAKISEFHCGGVPVAKFLSPLAKNGALLAGDAAGQVNALNGGGIAYALFAGKTAGEAIVESFENGEFNYEKMNAYEKNWRKYCGKNQMRSYALKCALLEKRDEFYNDVAAALKSENPSKLSYLRVFAKVFAKRPKLLAKVFFLFR